MAARVINLRAARKSAARDAARKKGDQNALKFGRSKAQKDLDLHENMRAEQQLDGYRLDKGTTEGQGRDD